MQSPSKKFKLAMESGEKLPPSAEERDLQERYAYFGRIMKMDKEARREELLRLSRSAINAPRIDPEERKKMYAFIDKLERISEYPTEAI